MVQDTLIALDLPPGVWKNGTRYQARGRYFETNRVRWHDGALRAIGGWSNRTFDNTEFPPVTEAGEQHRDMHAWRANDKDAVLVSGGNVSVKWIKEDGTYQNLTPVGLPPGVETPTARTGYGSGLYGVETYGTPRSAEGVKVEPVGRWTFDNYGEDLMAHPNWPTGAQNTVYRWGAKTAGVLDPVPNAPEDIVDFVVTDQRFVMTIGAATEARRIRWSDQENPEEWTPADVNQAGGYTLAGSGSMISISNVGKQVLILTETDAHVGRYIGPPYVYGFDRVGENCAPLSRDVVVTTNTFAVWLGERNFWIFDGSEVRELPCDLIDFLVADASFDLISKAIGWVNGGFTEVWWHYASAGAAEPDSYVAWDWVERHWQHGRLDRTAMLGTQVLPEATGLDHSGTPYWHELLGEGVEDAYAKTGPLEVGDGVRNLAIKRVYPDVEISTGDGADATLQFEARQMPTGRVVTSPIYPLANPTPVRVMGRDIMMTITGQSSGWEVGRMRIEPAMTGTGKR